MLADTLARLRAHLAPFADRRAWLVIMLLVIAYSLIDPVMFKAVASWVPQWLLFPALAVIVSRYIFPMIVITELMDEVRKGNDAAGRVVASIVHFIALALISIALFARVL